MKFFFKKSGSIGEGIKRGLKENPKRTYWIIGLVIVLVLGALFLTYQCMKGIEDSCKGRRSEKRYREARTEEPNPLDDEKKYR